MLTQQKIIYNKKVTSGWHNYIKNKKLHWCNGNKWNVKTKINKQKNWRDVHRGRKTLMEDQNKETNRQLFASASKTLQIIKAKKLNI